MTDADADTALWADKVWRRPGRERQVTTTDGKCVLATLCDADGLNTGTGGVEVTAWAAGMFTIADAMHMLPGDSVFSIGCGAGADLFPFYELLRADVGGIDIGPPQIDLARRHMPERAEYFAVADATEFDTAPQYQIVICFGVLLYIPISASGRVVELAVAKAKPGGAIGFFDIPRLSTRDAAIAERVEAAGGQEAYAALYGPGFQHQYFPDEWISQQMARCGLVDIRQLEPPINGYANGQWRDYWVGFKPA